MQGMITTPHLPKTFLYDVLRLWSLYLNRCVTALSSEDIGAAGATVPFSLEPILLELGSGRYVRRLLNLHLSELVNGRRDVGGGNHGGGGTGGGGSGVNRKGGKGEEHSGGGGGGGGSG